MNEVKKETPPLQAPAMPTVTVTPSISDQYKSGKSVYDIFKNYGKEYDYEEEKKAAEINRKGALISDIATSLSNLGTGIAGRRAYINTPPATAQSNAQIERLRALRAQGNAEYKRNRLNAMMQQLQMDRQDQFRNEDRARDDSRYKDQLGYRSRQEAANNEDRSYSKERDKKYFAFQQDQAKQAQKNADRNYNLSATNADETRKLRELQIGVQAAEAAGTSGKKAYIIGSGGKKYEYPKDMTDAVTANLFDVMREEAAAKGIAIDNMALTMGGNETKSSAMKAFVENNLSKYPKAEKALQSLLRGEIQEEQGVPSWITSPPQSSQSSKMQSPNSISVPKSQMLDMDAIIRQNKDERTQKTKMAQYLKAQGYKKEDIISILKTVTAE